MRLRIPARRVQALAGHKLLHGFIAWQKQFQQLTECHDVIALVLLKDASVAHLGPPANFRVHGAESLLGNFPPDRHIIFQASVGEFASYDASIELKVMDHNAATCVFCTLHSLHGLG